MVKFYESLFMLINLDLSTIQVRFKNGRFYLTFYDQTIDFKINNET